LTVTPWWQALKLRSEVVDGNGQIDDVQMSLYQAVYGVGVLRPAYADAAYFGEITYPAGALVDMLASVAVRLGGGPDYPKAGNALKRPDQSMGGGKSHSLIAAYHLAHNPETIAQTDLGGAVRKQSRLILGRDLPLDLGQPLVVVLPCDSMTPGAVDDALDGPARNLYQRFLWRLFSKDFSLYERYKDFFNNKAKIAEAFRAVNRPVLVLVDEIMNYMGNASDADLVLAGQDLEFLRAFTDVVNDVPNVAALVVMISSENDPMAQSSAALNRRSDINSLLERNGARAAVTANADFAAILRRRLFEQPPTAELLAATASEFRGVLSDPAWVKQVWSAVGASWRDSFAEKVGRCYPFHPQLIELAEDEWASVSGFQRVRSTIRIFAATVFALQNRARAGGWAPLLIGPGDLVLSDATVREAVLDSGLLADERSVSNYRSLAENEVVTLDETRGAARLLDLSRNVAMWGESNPRASERAATFIFMTSIVGHRPGGRRGASAPEVKAATAVPDFGYLLADADGVLEDLVNPDSDTLGMSAVEVIPGQGNNKPARYYLSTRLTHRMLVNNLRKSVTEPEKDEVLAAFAQRLANTGPFKKRDFVSADQSRTATEVLVSAGLDDARTNRLVVLDPAQFSLRNGMERDTLNALTVAVGLGDGTDRIPVEWASSAVFAVVNTQRRGLARQTAVEYLARERALGTAEVQADAELTDTGKRELAEAKEKLEKILKRAFQHVVFLAQPDPDGSRHLEQITFEDDNQTALNGTQVWKALVEKEKAFDSGQFNAKALVHNLREEDYNRPLSEIRDSFWSAPRLPLLYDGERDLQNAVYEGVRAGTLRILDNTGGTVVVTNPSQVNVASTGLRLAQPDAMTQPTTPANTSDEDHSVRPAPGGVEFTSGGVILAEPIAEKFISFPLLGGLLDNPGASDQLAQLFRTLYSVFDEHKASYAQGTLQLVLDAHNAALVARQVEALGLKATVRDQ
jgi:hypothetical protein